MSYLDWHVGMKVVCIGDYTALVSMEWAIVFGVEFPITGSVYTIREMVPVTPEPEFEDQGSVGVRLNEILNMPNPCMSGTDIVDREVVFSPHDFRPLVANEVSMAIFESLLNPSGADTFREREAEEFNYELNEEPFR